MFTSSEAIEIELRKVNVPEQTTPEEAWNLNLVQVTLQATFYVTRLKRETLLPMRIAVAESKEAPCRYEILLVRIMQTTAAAFLL